MALSYTSKDTRENVPGGKDTDMADSQLSSQMKKQGENKKKKKKKEKKRNLRIHPELTNITNKHRTATLKKMKLKRSSSVQFKQKK